VLGGVADLAPAGAGEVRIERGNFRTQNAKKAWGAR
jgi:hypothetical protein